MAFQAWQDNALQWNGDDYENVTEIVFPKNLIWTPEFGVNNSWAILIENIF